MVDDVAIESFRREAMDAYLTLLQKKGCGKAVLGQTKHVVLHLLSRLKNRELSSETYRWAVGRMLEELGAGDARQLCVTAAREFYPFLSNDVKAIAKVVATGGYRGESVNVEPPVSDSIDEAISAAEAEPLTPEEGAIYERYQQALYSRGVEFSVAGARVKLARLLLTRMRGLPLNGNTYRAVIDRLIPLFSLPETQLYFLAVAREFYYFLVNEPEAAKMISVEKPLRTVG